MPLTGSDHVDWIALARVNQGGMVKYRKLEFDGGQPLPLADAHTTLGVGYSTTPSDYRSGPWVSPLLPPVKGGVPATRGT